MEISLASSMWLFLALKFECVCQGLNLFRFLFGNCFNRSTPARMISLLDVEFSQ